MGQYKILVVEDDGSIRRGLEDALSMAGYLVCSCSDGLRAAEKIRSEIFDFVLLDVVLPKKDGFELLSLLREVHPAAPVIMLTAMGREEDRVRGLKLGADDYVVKPFGILELLARIEAVLRRSPERPQNVFERILLLDGELNLSSRELRFSSGKVQALTEKEFLFLRYLLMNSGRIVSREEILTRVWQVDPRLVETRSIDTTLMRLREKLGTHNAEALETVRGRGYLWRK